jgi:hypothetical protein
MIGLLILCCGFCDCCYTADVKNNALEYATLFLMTEFDFLLPLIFLHNNFFLKIVVERG